MAKAQGQWFFSPYLISSYLSALENQDQEKLRNLCEGSSLSVKLGLKLETLGMKAVFQMCRCWPSRKNMVWYFKRHRFFMLCRWETIRVGPTSWGLATPSDI